MTREFIVEDSTKLSWKERQALVVAVATYNTGIELLPVWEHIEKCPRNKEFENGNLEYLDTWNTNTGAELKAKLIAARDSGLTGGWITESDADVLVYCYGIEIEMRYGVPLYTRSRRRSGIIRYLPLDIKNPQIFLPSEGRCMIVWDTEEQLALLENTEWEQRLQDIAFHGVW